MGHPLDGLHCANGLILRFESAGLGLYSLREPKTAPLRVDFAAAAIQHRARDALAGQHLVRAMGNCVEILDATAGLGRDAFLLASAARRVFMLERNPVVHALLADGMERARANPELAGTIERMRLSEADFHSWDEPRRFDAVYLDPMFPRPQKRARGKKEMVFLQRLVDGAETETEDSTENAAGLLQRALRFARGRVVVKRPPRERWLGESKPDFSYRGRLSRFDVYLAAAKAR